MKRADSAFDEYFVARARAMRRVAYLVVGSWPDAEDVVQTAFVNVYRAWPRIDPSTRDAYVRKAVVNTAITVATRRRREVPVAAVTESTYSDPEKGNISELLHALRLLSPSQRAIISLRFLDDLSVAQVADALNVSEGTVKSQTSRGLAEIRARLPQVFEGDKTHE